MQKILANNKVYSLYEYNDENEFEKDVVKNSKEIFGDRTVYIDVKKKIGGSITSIPDGYLIDFTFSESPKLYIIENELVVHDAYKHIGQQLLKFAVSYKESGRKIKEFLFNEIEKVKESLQKVEEYLSKSIYRNLDNFLEELIFNTPISAIVIIDEITEELDNVLKEIVMRTDILEMKKYTYKKECLYHYTPLHNEILENSMSNFNLNKLDTIVVPANKEGFERVFLGEDCWHAIRISSAMIDKIKYIASYQTAPTSAVTYVAEVDRIEKYKDTNKYIIYFKDKARKINPIKLIDKGEIKAPQSPRYTIYSKLSKSKDMENAF